MARRKKKMNMLEMLLLCLVAIGGLNWGLVGAFNFNLVETILGFMPQLVRVVYIAVGVASLYLLAWKVMKIVN